MSTFAVGPTKVFVCDGCKFKKSAWEDGFGTINTCTHDAVLYRELISLHRTPEWCPVLLLHAQEEKS